MKRHYKKNPVVAEATTGFFLNSQIYQFSSY